MGGKDQQPASVDPKEPNMFYVPDQQLVHGAGAQERTHTNQGTVYVFANVYMYPEKPGTTGKIKKYDVLTGKTDVGDPGSLSELERHHEHRRRPDVLRQPWW